jgi:hypothetical protein
MLPITLLNFPRHQSTGEAEQCSKSHIAEQKTIADPLQSPTRPSSCRSIRIRPAVAREKYGLGLHRRAYEIFGTVRLVSPGSQVGALAGSLVVIGTNTHPVSSA